jgi:hypothetical protein
MKIEAQLDALAAQHGFSPAAVRLRVDKTTWTMLTSRRSIGWLCAKATG